MNRAYYNMRFHAPSGDSLPPGARYEVFFKYQLVARGEAHAETGSFRQAISIDSFFPDGEGLEHFSLRVTTPAGTIDFGLTPGAGGKRVRKEAGKATQTFRGRLGRAGARSWMGFLASCG